MKKQSVSNLTDAHGGKPGFRNPGSETVCCPVQRRPNQSWRPDHFDRFSRIRPEHPSGGQNPRSPLNTTVTVYE